MENRKIKNATPKEYNGIKFKSLAEVMVYKTLLQQGFNPQYESETFHIWEGFIPNKVPFYTRNTFNRKNKNIEVISDTTVKDNRPLQDITYTPDFIFYYNSIKVIVEVKGLQNDVFPYKFKMFRKYLERQNEPYMLWEIFTKKQLLECINLLKKSAFQ